MKEERVIELWREAARDPRVIHKFADLVAAETREECAKVFEGDWGLKATKLRYFGNQNCNR
jgi:hypothetical protein